MTSPGPKPIDRSAEREISGTSAAGLSAPFFDAIPNIVFVVDAASGAVEHVSECFTEYAGRSFEEARACGFASFVHPVDLARATSELRGPISRGERIRTDFRLRDRHGSFRWHDVRAAPVRRADGELERWFGTCTDIDDLRRGEREQALAVEVLTAVSASGAPAEILGRFVDALTAELADFCAVDLDEAGRTRPRRAAVALAPALGALPGPLALPVPRREREELARASLVSTESMAPELRGALSPLEPGALFLLPLWIGGEPSGHVWLASLDRARTLDQRDRRVADELVRRLGFALHHARAFDAAAHASRLRDEFLAMVSHELRTPLSTALGWARLLREDSSDRVRLRRGLEVIERSALSQSRIIDDLLDVSRAVSGKLRLETKEASIADILRDAVESLRPITDEKQIALRLVLEHQGRSAIDAGRIRQALDNLLSNAARFTPVGGSIAVALRFISAVDGVGGGEVEIEVADSGVGIDPSLLPFVFDRFRQGDDTPTRRHGGLGIGLAIVRAVAELHGGSVDAHSAGLDAGATFTLRLPLRPADAEAGAERASRPKRAGVHGTELFGVRILVVDDEADARELSSTILSFHGARVATAGSAKEAMRALDAAPVEILLSDIGMPDEDGVSLVRRARAAFPRLSAIALSAYARIEDEQRAIGAGFAHYLTKPVDPDHLVATVAALARAATR